MAAEELTGNFAGYEIERTLGNRSEAAYYLAEHELHGEVTLVVLHAEAAASSAVLERFRQLARARSSLVHSSIAQVLEAGTENGRHFLVLDKEVAGTLVDFLGPTERLEPDVAATLLKQGLDALHFAHESKQTRGEFKPHHVLVGPGRKAYLTGFDGARSAAAESDEEGTARLKQVMARLDVYMAPEYLLHPEQVDARSDLYAIGMIFFRMMTGMVPFAAESSEELAEAVIAGPPYVPSSIESAIPRELDQVILKAIEKRPTDRFQSAAVMRTALEMATAGESTGIQVVGPVRYYEWSWSLRMILLVIILQIAYLVIYEPSRLQNWGAILRGYLGG